MAKLKPFLIDGIKCQCGRPGYIHLTSVTPEGRVNFACDRYLYTRAEDGCCGYVEGNQLIWKEDEPLDGKEQGYGCVAFMNRT